MQMWQRSHQKLNTGTEYTNISFDLTWREDMGLKVMKLVMENYSYFI